MNRNQNYPVEYKQEMVELYLSKGTTITKFCEEEGLKKSTFFTWLSMYRTVKEAVSNSLIEVTTPIKEVCNTVSEESKFSLKINGYSLEFNIKDLSKILSVLKNG